MPPFPQPLALIIRGRHDYLCSIDSSIPGIYGNEESLPWIAWPSVPVLQWSGSLLLNKYSKLTSRATSLPDVRTRTTYAAGQNALSDSMSCFTCTKSSRDAIWSISPFPNLVKIS